MDNIELQQQVTRKCTPVICRHVADKFDFYFSSWDLPRVGEKICTSEKGSEAPGLKRRDELRVVTGKNNSPPDSRHFLLPAVTEGTAAVAASSRPLTAAWSILAASYLAVHMSHTSIRRRSQTQFTCTFMEMYGVFFPSSFPSRLFDQFRGSMCCLLLEVGGLGHWGAF